MKINKLRLGFFAVLLLVLLVGAGVTPAYAVPTLRFILAAPATTISCADQNAACDLNLGAAGAVTANFGGAPGVAVSITTGISKPVFAEPHMDLNSITVTTSAAADIALLFSDTDFTVGIPFSLLFGGTLTAPAGSTVSASAYYDDAGVGDNALFCGGAGDNCAANGSLIGTIGPFGPGAFAGSTGGPGSPTTPYSLTQVIRLHLTGPTSFSGDFEIVGVPEPASVALLGGALLLTVGLMRKKLRRS